MTAIVDIATLAVQFDVLVSEGKTPVLASIDDAPFDDDTDLTFLRLHKNDHSLFKAMYYLEDAFRDHNFDLAERDVFDMHMDETTFATLLNRVICMSVYIAQWRQVRDQLKSSLKAQGITLPPYAHPFYDVHEDGSVHFGYIYPALAKPVQ